MTNNPVAPITPDDYEKLLKIHLALHSQHLLSKKIIRIDRPDKLTSLTTYKGRTVVTQNLRKYPPTQARVPSYVRRTRELSSKGGRYCITWVMNPGYNAGFEAKLASTHFSKGSQAGIFEIFRLGDNYTETKVYTHTVEPEGKPVYPDTPGVHYITGDSLFNSPAVGITITVNTVGVMGAGLAAAAREEMPQVVEPYLDAVRFNRFGLGKLLYIPLGEYETTEERYRSKIAVMFPTKAQWRDNSSLEAIESGLKTLLRTYKQYNISSMSVGCLGCVVGALDWSRVKPMVDDYCSQMNIPVYVHLDYGGRDEDIPADQPVPREQPVQEVYSIPADGSIAYI